MIATSRAARLDFAVPPPGLEPLTVFELDEVPGAIGLYTLRDTVGEDLRLFLLDPAVYVPEYAPELDASDLAPVGAGSAAEVDVYVVATIADGAPVVNLLAPIVVNPATRSAVQVILDSDAWPLRAELTQRAA